ncbi:swarming motility protein SwrAA [Metabacillus sp. 84]|uniref:swarming motility protein SwrAA n=1 Tax=unclassified Metabacillus TaxID=2675274 RepID=UPI003CF10BD2
MYREPNMRIRNNKQLRYQTLRRELTGLMKEKNIKRNPKTEEALELFSQYYINYTNLTSGKHIDETIIREYIHFHLHSSQKRKAYTSIKRLKEDVKILESLFDQSEGSFRQADFSLLNYSLWVNSDTDSKGLYH